METFEWACAFDASEHKVHISQDPDGASGRDELAHAPCTKWSAANAECQTL
jgi:hypothetical protein